MFPKIGVPQNGWWKKLKTLLKWMIWGYHYFRKHPYRYVDMIPAKEECSLWSSVDGSEILQVMESYHPQLVAFPEVLFTINVRTAHVPGLVFSRLFFATLRSIPWGNWRGSGKGWVFWFGLGRDPFLQSGKNLTSQILVEEKKVQKRIGRWPGNSKKLWFFKYKRVLFGWDGGIAGWGS